MVTVRDLIASSLRLINVTGAGETMSADDANDALVTLNQMLDSWSADGQVIYSKSLDTYPLVGGVSTITMGLAGNINTARPVSITEATVTLGQTVYPLDIWSQNMYSTVSFPPLVGIPNAIYVNNGNPLLTLQIYPVPIGGLTLNLYSLKELSNVTLNTVLDLPPGYERALRYNLAVELCPEYDREPSRTVSETAVESLSTIKRNNQQYQADVSTIDLALDSRYMNYSKGWYNIFGGN